MARITFLAWPWVPWPAFVASAVVGVWLAWIAGWLAPGRVGTSSGWQGVSARVVSGDRESWIMHVTSRSLMTNIDRVVGVEAVATQVDEHDWIGPGLVGLLSIVVVSSVFWVHWHPIVRVVNVASHPIEVTVDGWFLAVVAGLPGESAGAGREFRIPEGKRVFRTLRLDASPVDETTGWVGGGWVQLYVPGAEGRCFRVEQRAYGRTRQPKPPIIELDPERSLHDLPFRIDAWFQPNPPADRDFWFSGGLRRSVRQAPCQPPGKAR
ncbi:MAG: hypothetical protein CSA75_01570 [Sorangium cellulosum]|nr:MAG: hypothetical protein CSA75_01570 [Sorangium cellulosum]